MYLGECACSVAAPPSLPWPLSGCSCCGHGAGRSRALGPAEVPAGGGRCVPPFTPPELCKASVSTRSQKESSALMLYNVFFFQVIFLFFPSFSLTLSILFLFFFSSWQCPFPLVLWQHEPGQAWPWWGSEMEARFLSQRGAESERPRAVPGSRSRPGPGPRPLPHKQNTLSAYQPCTSARPGHFFKAVLLLFFLWCARPSRSVSACFCSEELGR